MAEPRDSDYQTTAGTRKNAGNPVVNEARRILMRLATQLHSHDLDLAQLAPRPGSASFPLDMSALTRAGAREAETSPSAPQDHLADLPSVSESKDRFGHENLLLNGTVSGDQAKFTGDFSVFVREAPMTVATPPLAQPVIESRSAASFPVETKLLGGGIHDEAMIKLPEKTSVMRLCIAPPALASSNKGARSQPLLFDRPSLRVVPGRIAADIPLERRPAALPSEDTVSGRTARLMTRQLLAKAAGLDTREEEIEVIGIFRRVPIGAAAMLTIDDQTGTLCLYLRPDAARMVQSQGQQLASLVFGRVRSDGRLVRALIPTPNPAAR